jgi:hypothetical protein
LKEPCVGYGMNTVWQKCGLAAVRLQRVYNPAGAVVACIFEIPILTHHFVVALTAQVRLY